MWEIRRRAGGYFDLVLTAADGGGGMLGGTYTPEGAQYALNAPDAHGVWATMKPDYRRALLSALTAVARKGAHGG